MISTSILDKWSFLSQNVQLYTTQSDTLSTFIMMNHLFILVVFSAFNQRYWAIMYLIDEPCRTWKLIDTHTQSYIRRAFWARHFLLNQALSVLYAPLHQACCMHFWHLYAPLNSAFNVALWTLHYVSPIVVCPSEPGMMHALLTQAFYIPFWVMHSNALLTQELLGHYMMSFWTRHYPMIMIW